MCIQDASREDTADAARICVKRCVNDGSREAGNQIETKDRMDRTTSTVANSV